MPPTSATEHHYAINIADLLHDELRLPARMMIDPVTGPTKTLVWGKKGEIDTMAILLETDAKRALAICEFLQCAGRERGILVRCYSEGPRGGWKELRRNHANPT
jgi:hypothetical protein